VCVKHNFLSLAPLRRDREEKKRKEEAAHIFPLSHRYHTVIYDTKRSSSAIHLPFLLFASSLRCVLSGNSTTILTTSESETEKEKFTL
jgi:hypothetical protein